MNVINLFVACYAIVLTGWVVGGLVRKRKKVEPARPALFGPFLEHPGLYEAFNAHCGIPGTKVWKCHCGEKFIFKSLFPGSPETSKDWFLIDDVGGE